MRDFGPELDWLTAALLPSLRPYWATADDLPRGLRVPGAYGWTGRHLDVLLMDHLRSAGRWNGPAPAIVLNLAMIIEDARQAEADVGSAVLAVALHELAHVADFPPNYETPYDAAGLASAVLEFNASLFEGRLPEPGTPPWRNHGPGWLRIAVHAWRRADAAGIVIPIEWVWPDEGGAPGAYAAREALDIELRELEHVPLAELLHHKPPAEYVGLWQFKVSKWRKTQATNNLRTAEAAREISSAV